MEKWQKLKSEQENKVTKETDPKEYDQVIEFVKMKLFRVVKFIGNEKTMLANWMSKGSIGATIIRALKVETAEAAYWWHIYKHAILRGIMDKQNLASVAVKVALKGKQRCNESDCLALLAERD